MQIFLTQKLELKALQSKPTTAILNVVGIDGNMYEISRLVSCKNREKYTAKKNNYTKDSIYVVWQFAYVRRVARDFTTLKKKYRVRQYSFFLSQKRHQNPNLQNNNFYTLCTGYLPLKTITRLFWVGS